MSLQEEVYEQLVGRQQELREESGTKISLSEMAARLIAGGLDGDAPLGQTGTTKEKPPFSLKLLEMREKALLEKAEQIAKWETDIHDMADRVFKERKSMAEDASEHSIETFDLIMAQRDEYERRYIAVAKGLSRMKAEAEAMKRELEAKDAQLAERLEESDQEHRIKELERSLRNVVKMNKEQDKRLKKGLLKKEDVLRELIKEIKQQREFSYKDLIVPLSIVLGPSFKSVLEEAFANKNNDAKKEEKQSLEVPKEKT